MHGQHGSEPFQIKPSARTAFAQFAPAERAKPPDYRVLGANRRPDREIVSLIEGFLRDLRNEGFIECDGKERRRGTIADPKWKARVADMSMAVCDRDRLYAVTVSSAPVHLKRFALVYGDDYLRGSEIFAFDRSRCAVSKRDRSASQMFVECEPRSRFARGKVDQVVP